MNVKVKNALKRLGGKIKASKTTLMTAGAVFGVGLTVFLTADGQRRADDILAERDRAYMAGDIEIIPKPSAKERFDLTWQCYILPGLSAGLTIALIVGSQYLNKKEIAAISLSLAAAIKEKDKIVDAVREKYGEEGLADLRKLIGAKPETEVLVTCAEETGFGDTLCYEGYSGRWFRSSEEAVKEALKNFSDRFQRGEWVHLNDLYNEFGILESHFGWQFGYPATDDYYDLKDGIKYDVFKAYDENKGEDVIYIDIYTYPMENWYEY